MLVVIGAGISILVDIGKVKDILATTANQTQTFQGIGLYEWILILLIAGLTIVGILAPKIHGRLSQGVSFVTKALKAALEGVGANKGTGNYSLDDAIETAGYSYDPIQDIFYSNMNAWQRSMGYCRLYDEASAPLGMIIDCEPIYFEYDGKRWLIEFWKGQYDMTTGCEIGVYTTEEPDINIPGVFKGAFYNCAEDEDRLHMSFTLKKNGETLLKREDKHWWLTGFKLGEFSEPTELTMDLNITMKDRTMCNVFVEGLINAGYSKDEIIRNGNRVGLKFDIARTPKPFTRNKETDLIIQKKNKILCDKYQEVTGPYNSFPDKVKAIQDQAPEMYNEILNIGKSRRVFEIYEKIRGFLN